MQSIFTKYRGATNYKGSRISAKNESTRIFVHYDDSLSAEENHAAAVKALCAKMGNDSWKGEWIGGHLPDNMGMCWICNDKWSPRVTIK